MPARLFWLLFLSLPGNAVLAAWYDGEDIQARRQISEMRGEAQAQNQKIDDRFKRLELAVKNLGLVELANQLEQLNVEISKLRGQIELQTNQIETTQKRQRELYLDLDTRLRNLERSAPVAKDKTEGASMAEAGSPAPTSAPQKDLPEASAPPEETKPTAPVVAVAPKPAIPAPAAAPPKPLVPAVPPVPPVAIAPQSAPAPPVSPPAPPKPTAGHQEAGADIKAYEEAHRVFRSGDYQGAVGAFRGFIEHYPASVLAPSAQYWIGISYYNMRDLKSALASHQGLLKRYPESPKVPDSLLNIATIQADMGDTVSARTTLEDIIAKYPTSDAATKAKTRLTRR